MEFPFSRLTIPSQLSQVGHVALGTGIGQVMILLASPLLTRLYSAHDFGIYAYYVAAVGVLAAVATLRYELAIPIPGRSSEALDIATVALLSALALSIAIAASGLAYMAYGESGTARSVLWALPVAVAIAGYVQAVTYWASRRGRYQAVGRARSVTGAGIALAQIAGGIAAWSVVGLIAGELVGRCLGGIFLNRSVREARLLRRISRRWRQISQAFSRYRSFPLVSGPSALINAAANYMPMLIVGDLFGAVAAGWFLLAHRVIGAPSSLLVSAVAQVYLAEFARGDAIDQLRLYRKTLRQVTWLSGPMFLLGGLLSPLAFPLLFGNEWVEAGWLAMVLAPFFFCQLISGSTVATLELLQLHRMRIYRELGLFVTTITALGSAYLLDMTLVRSIAIYAIFCSTFYLFSLWLVDSLLRARTK